MSHIPGDFGKRVKCPCCDNPWNVSDSVGDIACTPCFSNNKGTKGLDPANFDPSVSPRENFFLFSNGGWMKNNPIPAEYPNWNTFIHLRDVNLERVRGILDELSAMTNPVAGTDTTKLSHFYCAAMDEEAIEAAQLSKLEIALSYALPDAVANSPTNCIAKLHSTCGIKVFFGMYSSPDKKNASHSLCTITQSGLGLPDRDYYFDTDKQEKRDKYKEYISSMFQLLGQGCMTSLSGAVSGSGGSATLSVLAQRYQSKEQCDKAAKAVIGLEMMLAEAHLTRTASRDPELTYNKMTIERLTSITTPSLDWSSYLVSGVTVPSDNDWNWLQYFRLIGKAPEEMGEVNVASVDSLKRSCLILQKYAKNDALCDYFAFHIINNCAPHLPKVFVDCHFGFHETTLKGTAELRPRWKRAMESLEDALGDALGVLYVQKHFQGDAKLRALRIVEQVRDALRARLKEVVWMSADSRAEALRKMEAFKVKIGYPDKFIDYSTLKVSDGKGDHLMNVFAGKAFAFALDLTRMNAPTDRSRWHMTPQTVNAYYHPALNEIVFPAAILQAPFFDPEADDAINFGSMGAVVGHEMTHGFDDQGRKFDADGCMRDWWAAGDGEEYERRVQVMIEQAEEFEVYGVKLKGKLTCGENVADLGGLKLALRALRVHLKAKADAATAGGVGKDVDDRINGLTPIQRFFLAWSQCWRENVKKERALQLVTLDPHGPNELRCNQPLSNMQDFCDAFGIVDGDKMWKPVYKRVDIW